MPATIQNGANQPINIQTGTVPDVSGGILDYFQPMVFTLVTKATVAFQDQETDNDVHFFGVIQPLKTRDLELRPEGERAWTWLLLHAEPVLSLDVDEIVLYLGVKTRVMRRKDYRIQGYMEYHLVQDYA